MKNFNSITLDSSTGTAVIGMGSRLGDIITALNNQGRAMPHGTCPYVGIGGHACTCNKPPFSTFGTPNFWTLAYGGYGFTSRMWGLTLDNILSLDVVLADGTITGASSTNNPDLYWVCLYDRSFTVPCSSLKM